MQDKTRHWKYCCKGFPKTLSDTTTMQENEYSTYKRSGQNKFILHRNKNTIEGGSEWVVPHCKKLLLKYECHINIEVVSSVKIMKYMFKYIHKGADRVLLEASEMIGKGSLANSMNSA
ncbi:unnamed protein product [Caenorhabditis nigoni]